MLVADKMACFQIFTILFGISKIRFGFLLMQAKGLNLLMGHFWWLKRYENVQKWWLFTVYCNTGDPAKNIC